MKVFKRIWLHLSESMWFIPAIFAGVAIALSYVAIWVSDSFGPVLHALSPRIFSIGVSGGRSLLSTIAQSIITVTGVAFSITIVALALASKQYSPRVLGNFMRDRVEQSVLGVLVGTFLYCLFVLRTINDSPGTPSYVPSLAVLIGILLGVLSVATFVYFIHHVVRSIEATSIIAKATKATLNALDVVFPLEVTDSKNVPRVEPPCEESSVRGWSQLRAKTSGYIQSADFDYLAALAEDSDRVLRVHLPVGTFVVKGSSILAMDKPPSDSISQKALGAIHISDKRTIDQDPLYGVRQIVDIALTALSPGVNDVTTAITCVEHLGAILKHLSTRARKPSVSKGTKVRLIVPAQEFPVFLKETLREIRQYANENFRVFREMLRLLSILAQGSLTESAKAAVNDELCLTEQASKHARFEPKDREELGAIIQEARDSLISNQAVTRDTDASAGAQFGPPSSI